MSVLVLAEHDNAELRRPSLNAVTAAQAATRVSDFRPDGRQQAHRNYQCARGTRSRIGPQEVGNLAPLRQKAPKILAPLGTGQQGGLRSISTLVHSSHQLGLTLGLVMV